MNQKSLSAKNKNHKQILNYLKNKKIFEIFKQFESNLNINSKFAVAVSGGPDSLSLAFLSKCFSLKHKLNVQYFIVDHGLRKESSTEAKNVVKILSQAPGCEVINERKDGGYVTPIEAEGKFTTYISRIRKDNSNIKAINIWVVSDNLLKGAALNTVQIAEHLVKKM